jgi:glycosyltransferase involved in cell wall biosynthesis
VNTALKPGVLFLRHLLNHISVYSGYENFIKELDKENISYKEVFRLRTLKRFDFYRRAYITKRNKKKANEIGPFYNTFSYLAEMESLKAAAKFHPQIIHNTFLEDNHGFLGSYKNKYNFQLIATIHQPVSWWKYMNRSVDNLREIDLLLTLTSNEFEYFQKLFPGRVRFVHHGVNTEFFSPSTLISKRPCRLLFVGNWLRDTQFFERVVSRIVQVAPEILIDMVYSINMDIDSPLFKLCKYPQVNIHRFINNNELLNLYNQSRLLFLPLKDSTANNALLEALSCGVPVVTTDLQGIRDYSNDCIAYYYKSEKDCLEYILGTIKEDALLERRSVAASDFMRLKFSLRKVAAEHAQIYRELY